MILDVGCGDKKRGEIGVDILNYPGIDWIVDLDKERLPFKDNWFEEVRSYHCIEHLKDPEHLVKEMIRVSKSRVLVVCPHRWSKWAKGKGSTHLQFLNVAWFGKVAKKYNCACACRVSYHPLVSFGVFGFFVRPFELSVELFKKG
jgi:ubiquinone/menaquinone biosynthesis C-methylase UbiE